MQRARRQQIIDVASRAGNEPLGFLSSNSLADRSVDREIHNCSSAEGRDKSRPYILRQCVISSKARDLAPASSDFYLPFVANNDLVIDHHGYAVDYPFKP